MGKNKMKIIKTKLLLFYRPSKPKPKDKSLN